MLTCVDVSKYKVNNELQNVIYMSNKKTLHYGNSLILTYKNLKKKNLHYFFLSFNVIKNLFEDYLLSGIKNM
jgi:hypothetical protein